MSQPGFPQHGAASPRSPVDMGYVPTDEEKRVFRECSQESFWYRSVPFSALGMAITQALISRGVLTPSIRFGSLPKLAFAGVIGYMTGKISYVKTCQEKFKNLENSPLGEALRQGRQFMPPGISPLSQSEFEDDSQQQQQPAYQPPAEPRGPSRSYDDLSYGDSAYQSSLSSVNSDSAYPPAPSGEDDDISLPAPPYLEEDKPKKKSIFYEELRSKNRENYEVTLTQKAETMLKPAPGGSTLGGASSDRATPPKKNIYGDTWEE